MQLLLLCFFLCTIYLCRGNKKKSPSLYLHEVYIKLTDQSININGVKI